MSLDIPFYRTIRIDNFEFQSDTSGAERSERQTIKGEDSFRIARPGVNNGLSPRPTTPPEARRFLSHLDDDLAFRTSMFDVGHRLFG